LQDFSIRFLIKMGVIKQAMLIGSGTNSIITTEAYAINGEFDIDSLGGTMNFNLPYILENQLGPVSLLINITRLKKFDTVRLYFGEFDKDFEIKGNDDASLTAPRQTASGIPGGDGLIKVFDGFIENVRLSKTKDAIDYEISAAGTVSLANYRNVEYRKTSEGGMAAIIREILDISNLGRVKDDNGDFIKLRDVDGSVIRDDDGNVKFKEVVPFEADVAEDFLPVSIAGGTTTAEFLLQLRRKYAIILHQGGDGILRLQTSTFFANQSTDVVLTYNIDEGDVFELNYGDLTNNYNAVVVFGFPPDVGVALDAVAVQNNQGNVNYLTFDNRSIKGIENCEEVARQKLLELERNFSISFKTRFIPTLRIGQAFSLRDNDRFTGFERWIIKKFSFVIDKGDVSATITGYTHSLTLLPSNIVLSNTGVADIDILRLRPKLDDAVDYTGELNL